MTSLYPPRQNRRRCKHCKQLHPPEYFANINNKLYCFICADTLFPNCNGCGTRVYRTRLRRLANGDRVCRKCYKERTFECDKCETLFLKDHMTKTEGNKEYCPRCRGIEAFYCTGCDKWLDRGEGVVTHSVHDNHEDLACATCFEGNYGQCDGCGYYWQNDSLGHCDNCDYYTCDNCSCNCEDDDHEEDNRKLNPAPQRGDKKGKYLIVDRLVGIEIEAENGNSRILSETLPIGYGIVDDASLSSDGKEVLTPPASLNKAEAIIKKACDCLKESGFKGLASCGLHVHLDAQGFRNDPIKLAQVLRTAFAIEDILLSMQPPSRWDNDYCVRLSKQYSFDSFKGKIKVDDFESKWYRTVVKDKINHDKQNKYDSKNTRHCGLNLHSTMYRGTVEIRYHAGTIDSIKILKWIYVLLKIINYATLKYNNKEVIALFSQPTSQKKLEKFFKIFGIRKDIRVYMEKRIQKFNPKFKSYTNGKYRSTLARAKAKARVDEEKRREIAEIKRQERLVRRSTPPVMEIRGTAYSSAGIPEGFMTTD